MWRQVAPHLTTFSHSEPSGAIMTNDALIKSYALQNPYIEVTVLNDVLRLSLWFYFEGYDYG